MTAPAEQLRSGLLALPETDRAELVVLLLESLEESSSVAQEDAFEAELDRRAGEIRSGKIVGISAGELFARLDARSTALGQ